MHCLRLPLRSVRSRPKPVAFFPPAWLLPGIICRPSSTLRLPTSNILPFGRPDPSSDSCTRLARNHGSQRRRGGDLPGPLSGTSTSLSGDRACLMQPRDSVASRNCAVRHWDHYNSTSERCQRIPGPILPQEIHTFSTPPVHNRYRLGSGSRRLDFDRSGFRRRLDFARSGAPFALRPAPPLGIYLGTWLGIPPECAKSPAFAGRAFWCP
jgi:hypothetical protein